ncbi:hypothetical protein CFOL_v3_33746 [Cephalotus follicularis]|uniref:Uncharacterized protein n=1 Tax=Cephalotus follicularis TaxID=3775 RepID=A0A1Q3DCY8_CEPFO|nr:hypothetical protein CFOL_v3_33746 [Cephalotus follicularis]
MAHCKLVSACLFFILMIFFQEIHSIEGRHLRLDGQNEIPKIKTYKNYLEKEPEKISSEQNDNFHGDGNTVRATSLGISAPSVVIAGAQPPPPDHVEDFRPTTPGHSPGVGHSLKN